MDSYEVVKGFAPMIRESVRTDRMPPYFADPHIGTFKNDQAMSPTQTKTLIHWLEAGAPRGTGEDVLKTQAGEAPEWPAYLGKPDVIVEIPAFDVPASGIVAYQNQRVDNPFKEDTWLKAMSIKPGDRARAAPRRLELVAGSETAALQAAGRLGRLVHAGRRSAGDGRWRRRAGSCRRQAELPDALHDDRQGLDRQDAGRLLHAEGAAEIHQALDGHRRLRPDDPERRGAP